MSTGTGSEATLNEVFRYIDTRRDAMLGDLEALCAYRSVAGDAAGLEGARSFIEKKMRDIGIPVRRYEVEGGNALLYAKCVGDASDTVLFYNHYDVVEEGRHDLWRNSDPFRAEISEGKIYARGVSDNKGGLLSRVHAVEALRAVCGRLPAGVKFLVEGDEETSSPSMTKFAADHAAEFRAMTESDVCVWENGRRDESGRPWARFGVRGSCAFDLHVRTANTDTHSRMGATIPSASWRLVWALASLKDKDERILIDGFNDRVAQATESDLAILEEFPYEEEAQKRTLGIAGFLAGATGAELKRRIYMEPSISICGLDAGDVHAGVRGIVPATAYARLSFYLVADQDPREIGDLLRAHLVRHGFGDIEVRATGNANSPVRTPVDIPFRARLAEAAGKVYGMPMVTELSQLGAGPAIAFRRAWPDLPVVGFGPGNTGGNHHAPNENLRIEDYFLAVKHVAALLLSY